MSKKIKKNWKKFKKDTECRFFLKKTGKQEKKEYGIADWNGKGYNEMNKRFWLVTERIEKIMWIRTIKGLKNPKKRIRVSLLI